MERLILKTAIFIGCFFFAFACDPVVGKEGELGNGKFLYQCVDKEDIACKQTFDSDFPTAIAVGGRFHLNYTTNDLGDYPVVGASSKHVEVGGAITGTYIKQPGPVAFFAMNLDNEVYDVMHLFASPIDKVVFSNEETISSVGDILESVNIATSKTVDVKAFPINEYEETLEGALDYLWTTDDDSIVKIVGDATGNTVVIEAIASGETKLKITAGGVEAQIDVEVTE